MFMFFYSRFSSSSPMMKIFSELYIVCILMNTESQSQARVLI